MLDLRRLAAAALLLAALAGCSKHDNPTRPPADQAAPDFSLVDQNRASATWNTAVSPRQYQNKVSVWYFAWAT